MLHICPFPLTKIVEAAILEIKILKGAKFNTFSKILEAVYSLMHRNILFI